tara:strand:+ start:535 stop:1320 length:786 start_codon:yes stop_codon:yes gene_type:complete
MKKIILKVVLLVLTTSFTITKYSKTPKSGIIVFEKKGTITNIKNFNTSLEDFSDSYIKNIKTSILLEREKDSMPVNFDELEMLLSFSKINLKKSYLDQFESDSLFYYHKYQDSLIIEYEKVGANIIGDYTVIYRNSETFNKLSKKDSTTFYLTKESYVFINEKNLIIQEYKEDSKVIFGYKCFKIVLIVKEENENDLEYNQAFKNYNEIYECYVTEEIKSKFHPIIKYKSLLKKYYPLEIKKKYSMLKSAEINYKIESINF